MGVLDGLFGTGDRVGVYVDGPNVLRAEFDLDLGEVRTIASEEGAVAIARVYLDENATPALLQACEARGFAVITTSGDVDVSLAVDATEAVVEERFDVLVIVSRDMDFKPVLEAAGKRGIRTVTVAPSDYGSSAALQNAADRSLTLAE